MGSIDFLMMLTRKSGSVIEVDLIFFSNNFDFNDPFSFVSLTAPTVVVLQTNFENMSPMAIDDGTNAVDSSVDKSSSI